MDKMPTARTGKKGREHLLRAVQLDSSLADAYAGLGLYNYFVDALSFWVKMLRFFIGIPGGDKALGKQQLERAIRDGVYTSVEARIYLAKNLRNYELDYFASIDWLKPLAERYPENPLIHLLLGDLYSKLNWKEQATQHFRAAQKLTIRDPRCAARVAEIARQALQKLPGATSNGN
jgi:tetratricopeptide (TPR) repeat protein